MIRAVWYRHWIEIRGGLVVASVHVALLALVLYPIVVSATNASLVESSEVVGALSLFDAMLPSLGQERFFAWGWHAWISGLAASMVGLFLAGTGVRSNSLTPLHPSHAYTLTLPVSRTTLVCTRFATSCAATVALFAAMLIVHVAVLVIFGLEPPLAAMTASSALAAALVIAIIAVFGLVMTWDDRFMGIVVPVAIVWAILHAWTPLARYLASQTVPATALTWIAAITMTALWLSAVVARRRDF